MHSASSRDTLHLLLLTHKQNDAEDLVSLLRNSGRATRAHMVSSLEDFKVQIQEKTWDLILAEPKAQDIDPKELFKQIKRLDKDLPVIILAEDVDPMQLEFYLKLGACDVVPEDESNLLSMVIQRELGNLNSRRILRTTQVKLRDAERRCQSLLESSKDAITYIHDGMHIYANQAYLDLFGYDNVDDLEGMPVMDMVASSDQENLKQSLKSFLMAGGNVDLKYSGLKTDASEFPLTMSLSSATYADESCTQIVIRAKSNNSDLEAKLKDISSRDLLTGLYNKPHFMNSLESAVDRAVLKGNIGAAMYINIDRYGKIKSQVGINNTDSVLCSVANYLKSAINKEDTLARIGEDVFAWVRPNINAEEALAAAEKFRDGIEHLVIDANSQTVTITASIGVALINDSCSDPRDILQRSHQAADAVRHDEGHEKGNGTHLFVAREEAPDNSENGIEKQVLEALKAGSFNLLFQPLINLKGDEQEHYETLLRMPQSDGEEVSAGDFLNGFTISEDLKRKIDRWVILHSTKLLSEHRQQNLKTRLFVNLSAASLMDKTLASWIGVALNAAKLDKNSVIFQFNEEDATKFLTQAQEFTANLKANNYACSLSRFGCSLKPFQTLKHLSLDYVKVDGSFTHELNKPESLATLKQVLAELHEQGLKTIVPLVESASAVASLWQLGTHFIQGYYVQPPQAGMAYNFSDDGE
ncbi:Predicted signal transduction protein [Oleispira antarctica RB-8]|mgnify:FL=1|uniref:Predicted signal transduction protein n=1 Tax=Oleispira antarctica RB-8 TaxID=698738 RepID=R4YQF4_OLEAN|nr:Predicted signal transduction protein [Oleispira antarctica RB-8]